MTKRSITFGGYDTAANGWTLAGWKLDAPSQKTNFVDIPGGDGSWDLSTALTDGVPIYNTRYLTVNLETSEGDRLSRKALIRTLVNALDGMRVQIVLPDDPDYYLEGRLKIAKEYNDLAHAAVTVTAVCDPWLYASEETVVTLTASSTSKTVKLTNAGRRAVIPTITVEGSNASILLGYGPATKYFTPGVYQWPDLVLLPGDQSITYGGTGSVTLSYREAVLE